MRGRLRNVVLALGAVLGALALALEFSARREAARIAAALEPRARLSYDSARTTWSGSVRLTAPRLEIRAGPWRGSVQARSATIAGDGWLWTLGRALSAASGMPTAATMTVRGLDLSPASGNDLLAAWLHPPGAALFEMQGCPGDAFGVVDRDRMRIHAGERLDRFDYRLDPASGRLALDVVLEQPGIAAVEGSLELSAFDPSRADFPADVRLAQAEFDYRDPGYLAARNALCAQRLGTSTAEFVERHLTAVDEFLALHGVSVGESVRAVYRRLVAEGGTLKLTVLPDPTWLPADALATPRGELLRVLNATARHNDAAPVMLQLAFADPGAPWIAGDTVATTSSAAPTPAGSDSSVVASEPARRDVATVGDSAIPMGSAPPTIPSDGPFTPTPPAPFPEPAVTPRAVNAMQEARPSPATVPGPSAPVPASAGVDPTPANTTASGASTPPVAVDPRDPARELGASAPPPPKDSTLALVWKPGVIERLQAREAPTRDYQVIATTEIGAHRGRRLRLLTAGGKLVDGEFRGVDAGQALMRVRVSSGNADIAVPLANVREIRLVVGAAQ